MGQTKGPFDFLETSRNHIQPRAIAFNLALSHLTSRYRILTSRYRFQPRAIAFNLALSHFNLDIYPKSAQTHHGGQVYIIVSPSPVAWLYIYIYIYEYIHIYTYIYIHLSLSLYIYIYTYGTVQYFTPYRTVRSTVQQVGTYEY